MYDEARPGQAPGPMAAPPREAPSAPRSVDIAGVLRRRWPVVALCGLIGAAGAYGASHLMTPRFLATSQIFIDPRGLQVLDSDPAARQQDSNTVVNYVESQARIITSQSVLARAVDAERLTQDPEFIGGRGASWAGRLLAKLGLRSAPVEQPLEEREQLAYSALYDRILVRRPERTFVIEVTARSASADKAARLANAVAQAYLESQSAARTEQARRATVALTGRLDELRERLRVSEERAEEFRRRHGLIGTRTQLVSEQQLTDSNTQLSQAQSRVGEAEARYAQIQQAIRGATQGSALPEAVVSSTISALRAQQAEARRRLADASTEFGPRHPAVRNAQAQVADLGRAIQEELTRIAQSARADLDRARASEASQRRIVEQLTTQASDASQASVQLRELQREVDVNRNLLNAFLSRSRETSELERLDTSNARIITLAQPPRDRTFPPRGAIMAAAGFVAGTGLGGGLVLALAFLFPGAGAVPAPSGRAGRRPVARLVS